MAFLVSLLFLQNSAWAAAPQRVIMSQVVSEIYICHTGDVQLNGRDDGVSFNIMGDFTGGESLTLYLQRTPGSAVMSFRNRPGRILVTGALVDDGAMTRLSKMVLMVPEGRLFISRQYPDSPHPC